MEGVKVFATVACFSMFALSSCSADVSNSLLTANSSVGGAQSGETAQSIGVTHQSAGVIESDPVAPISFIVKDGGDWDSESQRQMVESSTMLVTRGDGVIRVIRTNSEAPSNVNEKVEGFDKLVSDSFWLSALLPIYIDDKIISPDDVKLSEDVYAFFGSEKQMLESGHPPIVSVVARSGDDVKVLDVRDKVGNSLRNFSSVGAMHTRYDSLMFSANLPPESHTVIVSINGEKYDLEMKVVERKG